MSKLAEAAKFENGLWIHEGEISKVKATYIKNMKNLRAEQKRQRSEPARVASGHP